MKRFGCRDNSSNRRKCKSIGILAAGVAHAFKNLLPAFFILAREAVRPAAWFIEGPPGRDDLEGQYIHSKASSPV
jgi:hypothetical protein